ncbi:hypothetical protein Cni_G11185 [Canna indica]|uniref:Uncharacterized protein n=1 Tax=Canna indica TaxID=4628 RepID=A0AAQ3Q7X9_9LILI|nr:hypothetical protein Cni_G11185 [Canna indica]
MPFIKGCDSVRRHTGTTFSVVKPEPYRVGCSQLKDMSGFMGAFGGTRALEIVRRNNSPGLLWKRIKLTTTRKNNAKKRLRRVWQNEAVLKACAAAPQEESLASNGSAVVNK